MSCLVTIATGTFVARVIPTALCIGGGVRRLKGRHGV
jgi:hypothetical protein